jgi:hypothetical protein
MLSITRTLVRPTTNFGAGGFGQITSMKNPRIGELVLKLRF